MKAGLVCSILAVIPANAVLVDGQAKQDHASHGLRPSLRHRTLMEASLWQELHTASGDDIWNTNKSWATFGAQQPRGTVSNVFDGAVVWEDTSYLDLRKLLAISLVAYPATLVGLAVVLTFAFGMCLQIKPEVVAQLQANKEVPQSDLPACVVLQCKDLTEFSQGMYQCWTKFCRTLPSLFVFGVPLLLLWINKHYPQEVLATLTILTSFMIFMSGSYMVVFGTQGVKYLRDAEAKLRASSPCTEQMAEEIKAIVHWVVLPQYKEDVEIMSMTLRSIAQNSMASNIGVLLAMEEREAEAPQKAEALRSAFEGQLGEIQVCYHPANLPNDPPGKASNSAFAFHWLLQYLDLDANLSEDDCRREPARVQVEALHGKEPMRRLGWQGRWPVILTVADADSEFHPKYFEGLAWKYLEAGPAKQDLQIWQSPIFHIKNYHDQPAPVKVGVIFTSLFDLSHLSDPSALKFPYSTYSLSLRLARRVGGWDAEWIAEDWHMGIKCFLYTMGQCSVQPLMLPTCNYTPEDNSYWRTLHARWVQMKRHALGFSDFTYYFMMMPLIFVRASKASGRSQQGLQDFWHMALYGTAVLFKLVNVHVMLGLLTAYGALSFILKVAMTICLPEQRHVQDLFDFASLYRYELTVAGVSCITLVCALFVAVYDALQRNIHGPKERSRVLHWLKSVLSFALAGPIFFWSIGVCSWLAAANVLVSRSFKYEVALKPTLAPAAESAPPASPLRAASKEAVPEPA